MTTTTDRTAFNRQWGLTELNALCVKQRPVHGQLPVTGRLSVPPLTQGGKVTNDTELQAAIHAYGGEVVVIGHGQPTPEDIYVWRGTPDEFCATWIGD